MSRVFIVQQPATFDKVTGRFKPKYDLTPAAKFGRLVYIMGPGNIFRDKLAQAQRQINEVMKDYTSEDHILAVGDPVAIAVAVIIACQKTGGAVSLLKWDRIQAAYNSFQIERSV